MSKVSNMVRRARVARTNTMRNRTARLYSLALQRRGPVALPSMRYAAVTARPSDATSDPTATATATAEHVTRVVPDGTGKFRPECSCAWVGNPYRTTSTAKGQATKHRNTTQAQQGDTAESLAA